ncbi:phosphoserine phosphatase [Curtobacterium sp. PhB128]|nr:phosphoserine phosphatase [Curtobacterium sp. PhB128]TCL99196.1 phosphoserine phosphatase [Curtobacterium sp. PhB138]TCU46894.1 phosphoserine phosphatase [Curtobacterium sp. PhB146]TCU84232.1 phosphoserine phosphatase [Curtobacterium sp. PhB191]TDW53132.1 phosphoserine phosphatase [Curtobacterium sp. PhB42]TDW58098.1 phosphoserine phosphatase [Curtobacterium sp. PhB190]
MVRTGPRGRTIRGMDTLPSWRPGHARDAVEQFLARTTGGDTPLPVDDRVAVFDNDGTLWNEKPMPTQLHWLVQQWAAAASADPELARTQPYAAAQSGDLSWIGGAVDRHASGDDSDLRLLLAAVGRATAGMSVDDYRRLVSDFYAHAEHPVLGVPYAATVYQPMVELVRLLHEHGFTCYVVSAGERDFMRPMTEQNYGIAPEHVIGSAMGLEYVDGEVRYVDALAFFDDGPEKPVRVWSRIGRRPAVAVGNSDGDREMLEYTVPGHAGLRLLVHHDDDTGRGDQPYDKGAEVVLREADERDITVVSVRDDWATVFPT